MEFSLGTIVFIIAMAIAVVFALARGRKSALRRELDARPILSAEAIRTEASARWTLDPQTTQAVLQALGGALEVDPGRLRLTDHFDALWDMNPQAGYHQHATFEAWVLKRHPSLDPRTAAPAVGDLIGTLQRAPLAR